MYGSKESIKSKKVHIGRVEETEESQMASAEKSKLIVSSSKNNRIL